MGCDIHVLTERRYTIQNIQKWVNNDNWKINPFYGVFEDEQKMEIKPYYDDRDYELFSILANVRNYDDTLTCVAEPKGLPNDLDEATMSVISRWGEDGHSHSWFTYKELYDYWIEMPEKIQRNGVLVGKVLEEFDLEGKEPYEWCRSYLGEQNSGYRTWETEYNPLTTFMNCLLENFCISLWKGYITDYKSDEMKKLVQTHGDNYRVVFFFDN